VNDFKFYPPGSDDQSNHERSFYSHFAQGSQTIVSKLHEPENEKKTNNTLNKAKDNNAAVINNVALNHRISMCYVVFGYEEDELKILLLDPRDGAETGNGFSVLELPGDLATGNQTLENSARKMVQQLSGAENFFVEQVYSFGNPGKTTQLEEEITNDRSASNAWEITVAFFALLNVDNAALNPVLDSKRARWHSLKQISELSPYQNRIVAKALATLRFEIRHFPIAFELLPEKFTLAQVQSLYEAISGKKLDKRNFRKKLKALNLILPSGEKQKNMIARPSELFAFNRNVYADSHNSIL
jgi:8-oxo-dGTP diphosphatase